VAVISDINKESILTEFISDFLRRRKPSPGANKTDAARNEARWFGWRDMLFDALSAVANERRREIMRDLIGEGYIEAVSGFDVRPWAETLENNWHEEKKWSLVDDETFFAEIAEDFEQNVVLGYGFREQVEGLRRALILDGKITPTEADYEWLTEERDKLAAVTTPYDAAINKIPVKQD
jgi:hypothetical protein